MLHQVYTAAPAKPHAAVLVQEQVIGGRYRVEWPLASGAMGEVWRGRDEHLHGRPCAIKAVLLAGATAEERAERAAWFAREAEVLSKLHHPAICDIRDVISDGCTRYLVLELIEGRTLADDLAARGGPGLPEAEVLSWAATLCDALSYLHSQTPPITFRDLKLQNVMRRPDGRLALIDFGIARAMMATGGTAIGTGGYAPPEQYQGLADARSDVYGLAATLHRVLTGRDP
ncbi:MAG TPA: serine/threonine-protein kinase, partial [Chloroflexota bacterium]|nr:serine/threonine-protein kinase [Chloroflexota bacterium]